MKTKKQNNKLDIPFHDEVCEFTPLPQPPPEEIIDAVKLIENWVATRTDRDDWVIGGVACRKGFERLLKMYNNLKNENPY